MREPRATARTAIDEKIKFYFHQSAAHRGASTLGTGEVQRTKTKDDLRNVHGLHKIPAYVLLHIFA